MSEEWPLLPGRYLIGNRESPVAVCTLFSLDLIENLYSRGKGEISIIGKSATENVGIERIVKNIISNPNTRFLIICGEEPKGHFVGQALKCLVENGIDSEGKIIGAIGAMPYLKNISKEEVETFRKQVKIVDLIGCEDVDKILNQVKECMENNPGRFKPKIEVEIMEPIIAWHDEKKDVVLDPKGFFTIFIKPESKKIVVEHYTTEWDEEALKNYDGNWKKCMKSHKLNKVIEGGNAEEICHTVIRLGLVSRLEHAAYLGREIQKAEIALKNNLQYEQEG
ncbi:MAG: tetrahydromethanopterin S-methyltransferase subunit A [Candidatus Aenigmarchaeota archaeon]|nr:tetrahydromethanopterin S-methyltransferase subunit A [Candidatus Aenigmarchaeota archaeon]